MKKTTLFMSIVIVLASSIPACTCEPRSLLTMRAPDPEGALVHAPGWEGVTVQMFCMEIERYSHEDTRQAVDAARRILSRLDWQEDEGKPCDGTLNLTLIVERAGDPDEVLIDIGYVQFTRMDVNATFTAPGRPALVLPVREEAKSKTEWAMNTPVLWRAVLIDTLAYLWGPEVIVAAAADEDVDMSEAATKAFDKVRLEVLVQMFEDEEYDVRVRSAAAGALSRYRSTALPVLVQRLEDKDWEVRRAAARALGDIWPKAVEAVPALIQALNDENRHVREATAETLGKIGPEAKEAVPALIQALNWDEYPGVRESAAEALGKIGPRAKEAVPALIQALLDKDRAVGKAAADALKDIGSKAKEEDIPTLIQVLVGENWAVRGSAVSALVEIGPAAVPALIQVLENEDPHVRESAARALKSITDEDFDLDADRWREWWETQQ